MQRKFHLLYLSLGLACVLALYNFLATRFYLYWTVWWGDNLAHFLGGVMLTSLAIWFVYVSRRAKPRSKRVSFLVAFIFTMLIALMWEIFEYKIGATQSTESYSLDILHDLLSDALGAVIGWLVATSKHLSIYG